jgi:hypothetical protein
MGKGREEGREKRGRKGEEGGIYDLNLQALSREQPHITTVTGLT